ncbi:MAG: GNAT family N-acetyltransferase [Desulfoferrobacter sp.]
MGESHQIRVAQLTDATEIARLTIELGYPVSIEEISSRLPTLLSSVNHFAAVAAGQDSQLLGWALVEHRLLLESGDKAELTGLVVCTSARRTGVGKALVSAVEQWAAKQGLSSICVRSNITRSESHPFYQGLGYIRKKTQHFYEKQLFPR